MWAVESDPFLRTDFTNVTLLASAPDPARLRAGLERAIEAFPPLRQRVARPPLGLAPPQWADDPDFDLGYHLRRMSLPPPGEQRQLLDLAAQLAAMPLDRARPLWELTVVEGLAGGRAAVLQRLHHTLTDGVGGMKLLRSLLERTAPTESERAEARPAPAPDPLVWRHPEILSPGDVAIAPRPLDGWYGHAEQRPERESHWGLVDRVAVPLGEVGGSLAYRFGQGMAAARKGFELATTLPMSTGDDLRILADRARRTARSVADQVVVAGGALSPLMSDRSLARHFETDSFDLSAVRQAARAFRASRNAVFVAGVTGGLLSYHERMGAPCDALRMAIPLSLRGSAGAGGPVGATPVGGNRFAPARVVVPLGPKDPAKRVVAVCRSLESVAAEPGLSVAEGLAGLISLLPASVLVPALRAQARTVDFAASIVPGLRSSRFMAGAPVEASWPMGPRVGCAVNFTLLTWDDRLHLGVNLDPAAVSDPAALMECLAESFGDLLEAGA